MGRRSRPAAGSGPKGATTRRAPRRLGGTWEGCVSGVKSTTRRATAVGNRAGRERASGARRAVGSVEREHGPATAARLVAPPSLWLSTFGGSLGTPLSLRSRIPAYPSGPAVKPSFWPTKAGAALLRALDRREEEVLASAGSDRPMVEAVEVVSERSWDGSLSARAQIVDRSKALLEQDRAELEREEAALRADPVGEARLRDARAEVLGTTDREGETLV